MAIELYINLGMIDVRNSKRMSSPSESIKKLHEIDSWCKKTFNNIVLFDILSLTTRLVFQSKADAVTFKLHWSDYVSKKNELDNP